MYLLNPKPTLTKGNIYKFTFHYVSIKSKKTGEVNHYYSNLHSTMYLLNLGTVLTTVLDTIAFTFHYVSIKSKISEDDN